MGCRSATHKLLRSGSLLEKGLVAGRRQQENAGNEKTTVAHYDGILLMAIQREVNLTGAVAFKLWSLDLLNQNL